MIIISVRMFMTLENPFKMRRFEILLKYRILLNYTCILYIYKYIKINQFFVKLTVFSEFTH